MMSFRWPPGRGDQVMVAFGMTGGRTEKPGNYPRFLVLKTPHPGEGLNSTGPAAFLQSARRRSSRSDVAFQRFRRIRS